MRMCIASRARGMHMHRMFIEVNNLLKNKAVGKGLRSEPTTPVGGGKPNVEGQTAAVVPVQPTASGDQDPNPEEAIASKLTKAALSKEFSVEDDSSGKGEVEMKRYEFLVALVRIAINKYVKSQECDDVSEALDRLLQLDVWAHIGGVVPPPDQFRRSYCYTQECNDALVRHEGSLRAVFSQLVYLSRGESSETISVTQFLAVLRSLGFVDKDVSIREAKLAFAWSRMAVVDGETARGRLKETRLPFEGFIEAICRLSALKALPSTEQVAAAAEGRDPVFAKKGVPPGAIRDAGEWIIHLRKADPDKFSEFITTTGTRAEWGQEPRGEPVYVRVEHTILLLVRSIEVQVLARFGDGIITAKEAREWVKRMCFDRD